jgi:hypothetical protein
MAVICSLEVMPSWTNTVPMSNDNLKKKVI